MKNKKPCDNTLVKKVKDNGCNESYKILRTRHEKLFYKICQKYIPIAAIKGIRKEDVLENKDFIIFKAISSYKRGKKTKFSTWLGNCTKYYCLSLINANNRLVCSEEELLLTITDRQAKAEYDSEKDLKYDKEFVFNILNNLKDKRIVKVFKLRYFEDYKEHKKPTWSLIAKKIKTSTQTAINLHQRGKRVLQMKISSESFQDKI
jgi:DNA-directed RNA polymerase specialized sigma24 family protein